MVHIKAALVGITMIAVGAISGVVSNNAYDRELEAVVKDISSEMHPHALALFKSEPGSTNYLEADKRIAELRAQMPDYSSNTEAIFGVVGDIILGIGGFGLVIYGTSDAAERRRRTVQEQYL